MVESASQIQIKNMTFKMKDSINESVGPHNQITENMSDKIALYRKSWTLDQHKECVLQWQFLGEMRAFVSFCNRTMRNTRGAIYDLITDKNALLLQAEKIIWHNKDYFFMHFPQNYGDDFLHVRIFSWENSI